MKKRFWIFFLVLALLALPVYAGEYWTNVRRDLSRGSKNILGAPLEIPITIQEYHERSGHPILRHTQGIYDGVFRMIRRLGSGLWDFFAAWIPGDQEGLLLDPQTLF